MSRRENEPSRTINFCICLFVCLFIFPPLAQVSTLIFFTLEIFPGCQAPTFFLALFHNEAKSQKFCICVHFGRHQHLSSTCPIWSLNPPLQKKRLTLFLQSFSAFCRSLLKISVDAAVLPFLVDTKILASLLFFPSYPPSSEKIRRQNWQKRLGAKIVTAICNKM